MVNVTEADAGEHALVCHVSPVPVDVPEFYAPDADSVIHVVIANAIHVIAHAVMIQIASAKNVQTAKSASYAETAIAYHAPQPRDVPAESATIAMNARYAVIAIAVQKVAEVAEESYVTVEVAATPTAERRVHVAIQQAVPE